jgi:hypothetical protein
VKEPENNSAEQPTAPEKPLISPIRPSHPQPSSTNKSGLLARVKSDGENGENEPSEPDSPQVALEKIRSKLESVATEFSDGRINRAQFNAMYAHFSEQRTIIERLIERDPDSPAWRSAAAPGHTSFLRRHFEARLLYYVIYQHDNYTPLFVGGKQPPDPELLNPMLATLWRMVNRPKTGLARREMSQGHWLVMALGDYAVTMAMYNLEPSMMQTTLVRDLHLDFERANRRALNAGSRTLDRFVFPQRALAENEF